MIQSTYRATLLRSVLPLTLIATLFTAIGCSKKTEPKAEIIRPVKAMQAGKPDRLAKGVFTGKAKASREVSIAFEVPGRLIRFPVAVGDLVKAGQELAALDPRDYSNNVARVDAELKRAIAQRDRIAQALKSNAVAEQDLTDAEAAVQGAQALLDIAKKQLEDTIIRAPYDSTMVAQYVENYENVLAKQKVMRLLDISKVEMVIDVPENMIPDVNYVTDIAVTFAPFPDLVVPATISEVGSEASLTTRTYPVTLVIEQPESAVILAGMAGSVSITAELPQARLKEGIPVLPSAVFSTDDTQQSYVWTVDQSTGAVSKKPVTVDRFTQHSVMITDGLAQGEWVVTAGVHSLVEGQKVRILSQQ